MARALQASNRLMATTTQLGATLEKASAMDGYRIRSAFCAAKEKSRAALVGYLTCGYPRPEETVDLLSALEAGGCDLIELGVPFTDPMADGATIQHCNEIALQQGVGLAECLGTVRKARATGLEVPVVLMGYYNPFRAYGLEQLAKDAAEAGVDGFIIVDLPPEEAQLEGVLQACAEAKLGLVPLVAPTTSSSRLKKLAKAAQATQSMLYCVSVLGVTGGAAAQRADLAPFLQRVKAAAGDIPLAVGFGISTPEHVADVTSLGADGVVVGSAIIRSIDQAGEQTVEDTPAALKDFVKTLSDATTIVQSAPTGDELLPSPTNDSNEDDVADDSSPVSSMPDHFGDFGGRYIPETLAAAHEELEREYERARLDPDFAAELDLYRRQFIGGPTPLYFAERLSTDVGGAKIWLKREELAHTGAHKINNAVGQALLAKRLGKKRIIAETGAGQHGVATATVCALLGLDCVVYMGAVDCARQSLNVFRMNVLGAKVVPVRSGEATLKDAINEAMRDWVTNVRDTHYLIGSAIGPHPFPTIVRDFQSVIGKEARQQFLERCEGQLPDAVVACVGGGSNAIGTILLYVERHAEHTLASFQECSTLLSKMKPWPFTVPRPTAIPYRVQQPCPAARRASFMARALTCSRMRRPVRSRPHIPFPPALTIQE